MKKHNSLTRLLTTFTIILLCTVAGQSQILNKIGQKTRKAKARIHKVKDKGETAPKQQEEQQQGQAKGYANSIYVCSSRGKARGEGTKESPLKDVQKAIDKASDGDVVRIASGNYLGNLDRGWIKISNKYVSLEGGWNDDFTERDPLKYITRIQPGKQQAGTVTGALLQIEATANNHKSITIDGIVFNLGYMMEYCKADPSDPRFGCPEGCETGRIMPVGNPPNKTVRLIGGKVAGELTIRNCMFLNASFNAIIMTNMGGSWKIYNNVFVSNLYAACEINGGLNQQRDAHKSKVEFYDNTVMFSWPTSKEMESMGYGYRLRNGVDHDVHNNIFGCNNFGAIDGAWDDSLLPEGNRKICSAHDNLFFMNKGDIVIAGNSGGKWLYVPASRFEEVELLKEYEGNRELPQTSGFKDVIDPAYLKGYASLKVITTENYDAGSAANLYREAHGLNKQGTVITRVSMFGNRYNMEKAMKFWGAEKGYGAQIPKTDK